ncbi:MAG: SRPBCC family protein [Gaiellaceae bacterium]
MTNDIRTRRDFTLTWTLDAPPAKVFRAWTDPDHLDWFYNDAQPKPNEPIELDLRVGGVWRQHMVIDESTAYVTGGIYREVVPDEKLVFAWGATDGWLKLDPDRLDDSPLVTVTLNQVDGRTEMTVHVELPAMLSEESVQEWWSMGIRDGWRDTVDRLVARLARTPSAL